MLSRKRLTLIIVFALIVVCGGFIQSLFLGRDIPTAPPDAKRRTSHPLGFSIIVPPNWNHRIRTDSVGIVTQGVYLAPKFCWPPRRYNATLSVSLSDPRERNRDSDVLMPTAFQGQPAISSTTTREVGTRFTTPFPNCHHRLPPTSTRSSTVNHGRNHGMHAKHGMGRLQIENTWAVLGDAGRYPA